MLTGESMKAITLEQYINQVHGGKKAEFARVTGILPQQVTKWINAGYIVVDGCLYSKRKHSLKGGNHE